MFEGCSCNYVFKKTRCAHGTAPNSKSFLRFIIYLCCRSCCFPLFFPAQTITKSDFPSFCRSISMIRRGKYVCYIGIAKQLSNTIHKYERSTFANVSSFKSRRKKHNASIHFRKEGTKKRRSNFSSTKPPGDQLA